MLRGELLRKIKGSRLMWRTMDAGASPVAETIAKDDNGEEAARANMLALLGRARGRHWKPPPKR